MERHFAFQRKSAWRLFIKNRQRWLSQSDSHIYHNALRTFMFLSEIYNYLFDTLTNSFYLFYIFYPCYVLPILLSSTLNLLRPSVVGGVLGTKRSWTCKWSGKLRKTAGWGLPDNQIRHTGCIFRHSVLWFEKQRYLLYLRHVFFLDQWSKVKRNVRVHTDSIRMLVHTFQMLFNRSIWNGTA